MKFLHFYRTKLWPNLNIIQNWKRETSGYNYTYLQLPDLKSSQYDFEVAQKNTNYIMYMYLLCLFAGHERVVKHWYIRDISEGLAQSVSYEPVPDHTIRGLRV